jgi:hypothetical protein
VVEPNSVVFTEGFGEQQIRAGSVGGGAVEQIFSDDVSTKFSTVKWDMPSIIDNIDLARQWKSKLNTNLVQIFGTTPDGKTLSRSFTQAALLGDYEVALGSDTSISTEWKSNPAI